MKYCLAELKTFSREKLEEVIDFDDYSLEEIDDMIASNLIIESDVAKFYNNQWWADFERMERKDAISS